MPQPRQPRQPAAPGERAAARRAQQRPVTPAEVEAWRQGLASGGKATAITGTATTAAAGASAALVAAIAAKGAAKLTAAQVKAATARLLRALGRYARRRESQLLDLAVHVFVEGMDDPDAAELRALRAMEAEFHREFLRRQERRVRAEMERALAAGTAAADPVQARRDAVERLLTRERRWTAAHEEAVAARATGWAEAVRVARLDPDGAVVWTLGPRREHTPDCEAMHRRVVPLAALVQERFIPPVHFLCGCRLRTRAEAEQAGLIRAGAPVPTVAAARQLVRAAKALDGDHAIEAAAVERALEAYDPDQPRWPKGHPKAGRWRPKGGVDAATGATTKSGTLTRDLKKLGALLDDARTSVPGDDEERAAVRLGQHLERMSNRHGVVAAYDARSDELSAQIRDRENKKRDLIYAMAGDEDDLGKVGAAMRAFRESEEGKRFNDETARLYAEAMKVRKDAERARHDAIVWALSQVRPMGGKIDRDGQVTVEQPTGRTLADGTPEVAEVTADAAQLAALDASLAAAARLLPSEWIRQSNKLPTKLRLVGTGGRASYSGFGDPTRAGRLRVNPAARSTMLHELGHRMEHATALTLGGDQLGARGAQYRAMRTRGEALQRMSDIAVGQGYGPGEVTLRDRWRNAYTGRVYGNDMFTEVLTMGLERLYYPTSDADRSQDRAHVHWVLGILATS